MTQTTETPFLNIHFLFIVKTNWYHDTMICVLWMKKIKLT